MLHPTGHQKWCIWPCHLKRACNEQPIPAKQLRYQQEIPLAAISFTEGIYLISKSTCHAMLAEEKRRQEEKEAPKRAEKEANQHQKGDKSGTSENKEPNKSHKPVTTPATAPAKPKPNKYKRQTEKVASLSLGDQEPLKPPPPALPLTV